MILSMPVIQTVSLAIKIHFKQLVLTEMYTLVCYLLLMVKILVSKVFFMILSMPVIQTVHKLPFIAHGKIYSTFVTNVMKCIIFLRISWLVTLFIIFNYYAYYNIQLWYSKNQRWRRKSFISQLSDIKATWKRKKWQWSESECLWIV